MTIWNDKTISIDKWGIRVLKVWGKADTDPEWAFPAPSPSFPVSLFDTTYVLEMIPMLPYKVCIYLFWLPDVRKYHKQCLISKFSLQPPFPWSRCRTCNVRRFEACPYKISQTPIVKFWIRPRKGGKESPRETEMHWMTHHHSSFECVLCMLLLQCTSVVGFKDNVRVEFKGEKPLEALGFYKYVNGFKAFNFLQMKLRAHWKET